MCELKKTVSQVPVVHAYNPSYSGGRDQEDGSWRLAWAKCENLSKNTQHKENADGVAQVAENIRETLNSNK
jgi:hypothetical protein